MEVLPYVWRKVGRMNTLMREGWVCPVCGNVNAPWVASCPCGGQDNNTSYNATRLDEETWEDHVGIPRMVKRYER